MENYTKISLGGLIFCIIGCIYSALMMESYRGMSFVLDELTFWFNLFFIFLFGFIVCAIAAIYFYKKGK